MVSSLFWITAAALWIVALVKLTADPRRRHDTTPDYVSGAWLAAYRRLKDDE